MLADDLAVLQSILTNFGTGFFSAGLVLTFEPQVRKAVRRVADDAVEQAADKVYEEFDTRFKDLQDQINEGIQSRITNQDEALESFSDLSYDSALAAMKAASDIRALDHDQITVEGTDQPGEFTVSFAVHPLTTSDAEKEVLRVMVETKADLAVETWVPSVPFSQVALALLTQLTSKKAWGYSKEAPWRTVTEKLGQALKIAVESQREDEHAVHHLQGRLAAVINEDLFLTDKGLEAPAYDYLLPRTDFPQQVDLMSKRRNEQPEKPEWLDSGTWEYALERCRSRFTKKKLGSLVYSDATLVPIEPRTPAF